MKKLAAIAIGLGLMMGTVSFAKQDDMKKTDKKMKKSKKKKTDAKM